MLEPVALGFEAPQQFVQRIRRSITSLDRRDDEAGRRSGPHDLVEQQLRFVTGAGRQSQAGQYDRIELEAFRPMHGHYLDT